MSLENDPVVNPMDLDPIVSSPNLKDTVSTAFAPSGLVKEDAEKIKTTEYLRQKGYGVDDNSVDSYKELLFGNKNYSAINNQLSKQLSIEPLGPVKGFAKTKSIPVPEFMMSETGRVFTPLQLYLNQKNLPTGSAELGILAESAAQAPIGAIYGAPAAIASALSTGLNFVGDISRGSGIEDLFYNAGARAGDFSEKLLASGRSVSAVINKTADVPQDIREGFVGQFMAGGGSMIGFIGTGMAGKAGVVPAMTGSLYTESYDRFSEKYDTEESRKLALMYTSVWVPLEMYSFGQYMKPLKGGGIKALIRKGVEAVPEALTEGGEQFTADMVVDEIKDPTEYLKTIGMTYLTTLVVAGGVEYGSRQKQIGQTRDALVKGGMTPARATDTAIKLAQTESQAEYDKVFSESIDSGTELVSILNTAAKDIAQSASPAMEVKGFEGGVITQDDLSVYRNKEGFVESLDDSPQADLLRTALTSSDEAVVNQALDEYNQGLAGKPVEEEATTEQPAAQETTKTNASLDEQFPENMAMRQEDSRALLKAMGSEKQIGHQVLTDEALLTRVRESGMVDDAVRIANELINTERAHTADEHISLVLAANERISEINQLNRDITAAVNAGENTDALEAQKSVLNGELETIALATDKSGSPLAQAFRVRRLKPDLTYDEPSVRARAAMVKGETLSADEFIPFKKYVDELAQWEELAVALQKDIEKLESRTSEDIAGQAVTEIAQARTDRKKTDAVQKRKDAKTKLAEMGVRVNDITGLTVEGAKLISDIAVSYIEEGAATLEEVVNKVKNDIPDASNKNIYDALGGRVKRAVENTRTEAQNTIAELKTQARLQGEIMDAMEGILDPAKASRPTSKEVSDLRNKLALYKASIVNTERDALRVNEILDRISQIDDMVGRAHKPIPVIRTKTADLVEAEKMLKIANAELSAKNRIALLEEMLRDETASIQQHKDKPETSKRLDEFRATIKLLEEQLGDRKKEAKRIENEKKQAKKDADELALITGEIEQAFRRIKKPSQPAEQKNADLKLIRSRQDQIFSLIDILNGNEQSKPIKKVQVEDSAGYLAMVKELKSELSDKRAEERAEAAKKRREERADEQIKRLTNEVEKFIRDIPRPVQPKEKTGREDSIKALNEAKRQQDKVADLFEIIRNKTVPEKVAKTEKADPNGYLDTIKNLREEIKKTEWYQEWKQVSREAAKLIKTEADIAEFERRIAEEDYEGFVTPKKERIILDQKLADAELKRFQLKREIERRIRALRPKTWQDWAKDIYNIPRSAKLTLDVGHILRQGGFALSNPRKMNIFKFGGASFKALGSQEKADIINKWVVDNQYYEQARNAGLHLVEEGDGQHGVERILQENLLDDLPVIGRAVKASARTQLTSMNLLRMQMFQGYMERHPGTTSEEQKQVADVFNILTGYGTGKTVAQIATAGDWFLTSTRFTASRLQSPFVLAKKGIWKNKNLRNEIIEDTMWFWGFRLGIMALLASLWPDDMKIGTNPLHHTYGKLVVDLGNGTSRIYDPWAGLQQTGTLITAIVGGKNPPLSVFFAALAKKVNPAISAFYNFVYGKKYPNQDVSRMEALVRGVAPISLEGVTDSVIQDTGIGDMIAATTLDLIGLNSYTVNNDDLEDKTTYSDYKTSEEEAKYRKQLKAEEEE